MLDAPAANHQSEYVDDPMASDLILRNLDTIGVKPTPGL